MKKLKLTIIPFTFLSCNFLLGMNKDGSLNEPADLDSERWGWLVRNQPRWFIRF